MTPQVVFAPDVPVNARRSIERFPEYWQRRSEPLEEPDRRALLKSVSVRAFYGLLFGGAVGAPVFFGVGVVMGFVGMAAGWSSVAAVIWVQGCAGAIAWLGAGVYVAMDVETGLMPPLPPHGRNARRIRACHGRYVAMDHLDHGGRKLFERAWTACEKVATAHVTRDGMLGDSSGRLILDDELWSLAERLEHESFQAASLRKGESRDPASEPEAALKRRWKAVRRSRTATSAKVEALETYAERVRVADSVYLASPQTVRTDDAATALRKALKEVQNARLSISDVLPRP